MPVEEDPEEVVGHLVAAIERIDVNLDQMQPGSPFLEELARNPDPGIPYLMLTGDTSLVPRALQVDADGLSPLARLLSRLLSRPLLHAKRQADRRFARLTARHSSWFERKWFGAQDVKGSPDFSSQTDLTTSFAWAEKMSWIPYSVRAYVAVVLAAMAPLFPVLMLQGKLLDILLSFFTHGL